MPNEITKPQFIINEVDSYETYNRMKEKAGDKWEEQYGNQLFIIEESNDVRGYDERPRPNSENLVPSDGIYNFVKDEASNVGIEAGLKVTLHDIDEGAHQDIRQEIEDNKNWCHSETEKKTTSFTLNLEIPVEGAAWSTEASGGYSLLISAPGVEETHDAIIGLNLANANYNDIETIQTNWSKIKRIITKNDQLWINSSTNIFDRNKESTLVPIPIQARVIKDGVLNG